jgi:organic hydroperoxide reductase OsmC/OhrA
MHPYPHHYAVTARGAASGAVAVSGEGLPLIDTAPPPQFGGPDGVWSPETLLAAAVADCLILSFRGVARVNSLAWEHLDCTVDAILDRVEGQSRFVHYSTKVVITVPTGTDEDKVRQLLVRAEHGCLVANSLNGTRSLDIDIRYPPS